MVISFGNKPDLHPLLLNGTTVEQVDQSKLLGVIIQSYLKWDANTHYINKKAARRLHYIICLKKAGLPTDELLRIYLSLVRTVCEYACQVWATCLTEELCTVLESIQRPALIIIVPHLTYEKGWNYLELPLLKDRRKELCASFFNQMTIDDHPLNDMIPEKKINNV